MKLGYKYYRNNLIKSGILSIGCLGIFWDHLRGQGNPGDEPAALVLIAAMILFGNPALFLLMRRAKHRELAQDKLQSGSETSAKS